MSRPAQNAKKPDFFNFALILLVVYMGYFLFLNQNKTQSATPDGTKLVTRADYLAEIRKDDRLGLEATAQRLLGDYDSAIDRDVKAKVISPQEGESEKIQGATIVANSFLRGGFVVDDTSKMRSAYQVLQPYFRRDQDNPGWTTPVQVYARNPLSRGDRKHPEPEKPFVLATTTAKDLYEKVIDTVSARNRTELVWRLLPGGYQLIDFLVHLTGASPNFSYWFAAFLLALVVRSIIFPVAQKQLMFSRQMSQLTPRLTEIKKQYKDDQVEQNKRVMGLYKEYGINPAAGCLPAFIQMPLFYTVYQCMLLYQFEFSKGQFLWINSHTSEATHGIVAANLGQQDYILIVIYGITMTVSTMLTPISDPTQAKQQRLMGIGMSIMITVFMFIGVVPVVSGFVLYWTFTNLLATAQSFRAYRMPLPPLVKVNAPGGGVYPSAAPKGVWMKLMEDAQRMAEHKPKAEPSEASNGISAGSDLAPKRRPALNGSSQSAQPKNGKPAEPTNGVKPKSTGNAKPDRDNAGGQRNKPKKRT